MTPEEISRVIGSLPPEEVEDFVAFLHERHGRRLSSTQPSTSELGAKGFIGMWRDRDKMRDSTAWVRNVRESEW